MAVIVTVDGGGGFVHLVVAYVAAATVFLVGSGCFNATVLCCCSWVKDGMMMMMIVMVMVMMLLMLLLIVAWNCWNCS